MSDPSNANSTGGGDSGTFDESLIVARVYAEALFELAQADSRVPEIQGELDELVKLVDSEAAFATFLSASGIDPERRKQSLEKLFRGKLSDMVLNTLLVMADHDRLGMVVSLRNAFSALREAMLGFVRAVVVSAIELTADQRSSVEATIADVTEKKPQVDYLVDEGLIGGMIVRIGDWQYDNSLKRRLNLLHEKLRNRSDRGLAVGVEA